MFRKIIEFFTKGDTYCGKCKFFDVRRDTFLPVECKHPSNICKETFKTWHGCGVVEKQIGIPSKINWDNRCSNYKEKGCLDNG
jgi:hypothetical protein